MSLKQWQKEAIELKRLGRSGRAIARILGRSKSSVNNFFYKNRNYVGCTPCTQAPSSTIREDGLKIAVVADTQCKPIHR